MVAVLGEMVRAACGMRRSGTDLARVFEAVGSLVDGSGADGAVRPEMEGLSIVLAARPRII